MPAADDTAWHHAPAWCMGCGWRWVAVWCGPPPVPLECRSCRRFAGQIQPPD